ncbi:MAG: flavodoxin domain-containing protein, partial [Limisphaerales bacterium]
MSQVPFIPDTAPFTVEQRAWLNGFLAGLFSREPAGQTLPGASPANGQPSKLGEPLFILFGSQTGTAEGLAKSCAKEAAQRGFAPKVLALDDYEQANLASGGKAIIVSSTWGEGDPPDNAAGFWSWLNSAAAPQLEELEFAVLGLGDKNYSDFCGASKKFDARLKSLGAKRLVPRGECDVDYEPAAKSWMSALWDKLAPSPGSGDQTEASLGLSGGVSSATRSSTSPGQAYSRNNPFPARLLRNVLLSGPGSDKEVRHYEISLAESGLMYSV